MGLDLSASVAAQDAKPAPVGFRVRPGRRGDAEAVKALIKETGFNADAPTVTWIISHPEMELLVAADALDRAIGAVAISHRPQLRYGGRVVTIDELVVTETWRRKGVGRELLKRAVDRARVLGAKNIEAQTLGVGDAAAVATFFARCGFQEAPSRVFRLP